MNGRMCEWMQDRCILVLLDVFCACKDSTHRHERERKVLSGEREHVAYSPHCLHQVSEWQQPPEKGEENTALLSMTQEKLLVNLSYPLA